MKRKKISIILDSIRKFDKRLSMNLINGEGAGEERENVIKVCT